MTDAEIILNLWYVHDDMGLIYSLRARAYVGLGTDDDKLAMLEGFANTDYLIAQPFPIPDRFHLEIEENGTRRRLPVAPQEYLNGLDSPLALWEDAIKQVEAALPAQTEFAIPAAPVFCTTALLADDSGRLFSGRRLLRLCQGDQALEINEPSWALIVAFLVEGGWQPSASADALLSGNHRVTDEDALALAATGQEALGQVLADPRSVQIRFDIRDLAAIVDLAAAGGFEVRQSQDQREWRAAT